MRPLALDHEGQTSWCSKIPAASRSTSLLGAPMETGRFLHLAIGIVAALRQAPPARPRPQGPQAGPYPA